MPKLVGFNPFKASSRLPTGPVRLNANSPQADGLVACWPMFGGLGSSHVVDLGPHQKHGVAQGLVVDGVSPWGHTPSFPADSDTLYTDDYVLVDNPGDDALYLPAGNGAMSAWSIPDFGDSDLGQNIMAVIMWQQGHANAASVRSYLFGWRQPGSSGPANIRAMMACAGSADTVLDTTGIAASPGQPAHIIMTWDPDNMHVYVNGGQDSASKSRPSPGILRNSNLDFYIGRGTTAAGYRGEYRGWLHDCRLYDRTISADEAAAMYDPTTRWDLYETPRTFVFIPAAATLPSITSAGGDGTVLDFESNVVIDGTNFGAGPP